jgi:hypothetical protein
MLDITKPHLFLPSFFLFPLSSSFIFKTMNTTGPAFDACSPKLRQRIEAWSEQLDAILDEAYDEGVSPHWLLAELTKEKKQDFRKVQSWNAFLREEAKGRFFPATCFLSQLVSFVGIFCILITGFYNFRYQDQQGDDRTLGREVP